MLEKPTNAELNASLLRWEMEHALNLGACDVPRVAAPAVAVRKTQRRVRFVGPRALPPSRSRRSGQDVTAAGGRSLALQQTHHFVFLSFVPLVNPSSPLLPSWSTLQTSIASVSTGGDVQMRGTATTEARNN